jgi:hypothetical protein
LTIFICKIGDWWYTDFGPGIGIPRQPATAPNAGPLLKQTALATWESDAPRVQICGDSAVRVGMHVWSETRQSPRGGKSRLIYGGSRNPRAGRCAHVLKTGRQRPREEPRPYGAVNDLFPPLSNGGSCVTRSLCKGPKQDREGPCEAPKPYERSLFDATSAFLFLRGGQSSPGMFRRQSTGLE